MGPTNIHHSGSLLSRAGQKNFNDQATFQPFGRPVFINTIEPDQLELNHFVNLLNSRVHNIWISRSSNGSFKAVEAAAALPIPKICISAGLADPPERRVPRAYKNPSPPPAIKADYTYILIIEGKSASREAKIVAKSTLQGIADTMMHEALNGYSVVLSAAILRRNYNKLFGQDNGNWKFKQVDNVESAIAVEDEDKEGMTIAIIC